METKNETTKIIGEDAVSGRAENSGTKKKKFHENKSFPQGFLLGVITMSLIAIGAIYFLLAPYVKSISIQNPIKPENMIKLEDAKTKTENFINNYLMNGGKITVKNAGEEYGLYKIVVDSGNGKNIDTYITKDGKLFFQSFDIEKIEGVKNNAAPSGAEIKKSDKPEVELFVMSHCPYGTQIEKGILPVVSALGSKINFDLKFTDYAMHGEKELKEELNQYCIKTGEPAKFNGYLKCFIESANGDSATCLKKTGINTAKLKTCVDATDKQFKVTANFKDKTAWNGNFPTFNIYKESNAKYGVQGSPTLIINGATATSGRDSASLLKTICSAFNTPPKECETTLSSASPSTGFGVGTSGSAGSASCGS